MPRNIYGVTKTAAEDLCELVHRDHGLPVPDPAHLALLPRGRRPRRRPRRLPRREPEGQRAALPPRRPRGRRERAPAARSSARPRSASAATSSARPRRSRRDDLAELRADAPAVVRRLFPAYEEVYAARGWRMFPTHRARLRQRARAATSSAGRRAGTSPTRSSASPAGEDPRSELAADGRRQGLPRRADRRLHRALSPRAELVSRGASLGRKAVPCSSRSLSPVVPCS